MSVQQLHNLALLRGVGSVADQGTQAKDIEDFRPKDYQMMAEFKHQWCSHCGLELELTDNAVLDHMLVCLVCEKK